MSNPKSIDERIADLPETIREQKLEGLPDEFKHWEGKSVADVFKSQLEGQSALTKANQDKSTAQKLAEELDNSNKTLQQQLTQFKDDVYMTKADFKKMMKDLQPKDEGEKLTKEEIVETVRMENLINKFSDKHPDLGNDDINAIVQFGINTGAKTLDEAYVSFQTLAKKMGLKDGEGKTVVVPSQINNTGTDDGDEKEAAVNGV